MHYATVLAVDCDLNNMVQKWFDFSSISLCSGIEQLGNILGPAICVISIMQTLYVCLLTVDKVPDDVSKIAPIVGISINKLKTKVIRINTTNSQPKKIGEKTIEPGVQRLP